MEAAQMAQMKQLESKHEREIKELNTKQAKISVETSKEVNNDKTLKTKGEKDRRLREKKQNNIKRFMDEKKVIKFCNFPLKIAFKCLHFFLSFILIFNNYRVQQLNKVVKRRN